MLNYQIQWFLELCVLPVGLFVLLVLPARCSKLSVCPVNNEVSKDLRARFSGSKTSLQCLSVSIQVCGLLAEIDNSIHDGRLWRVLSIVENK